MLLYIHVSVDLNSQQGFLLQKPETTAETFSYENVSCGARPQWIHLVKQFPPLKPREHCETEEQEEEQKHT